MSTKRNEHQKMYSFFEVLAVFVFSEKSSSVFDLVVVVKTSLHVHKYMYTDDKFIFSESLVTLILILIAWSLTYSFRLQLVQTSR